jgi:hypothetical protein
MYNVHRTTRHFKHLYLKEACAISYQLHSFHPSHSDHDELLHELEMILLMKKLDCPIAEVCRVHTAKLLSVENVYMQLLLEVQSCESPSDSLYPFFSSPKIICIETLNFSVIPVFLVASYRSSYNEFRQRCRSANLSPVKYTVVVQ